MGTLGLSWRSLQRTQACLYSGPSWISGHRAPALTQSRDPFSTLLNPKWADSNWKSNQKQVPSSPASMGPWLRRWLSSAVKKMASKANTRVQFRELGPWELRRLIDRCCVTWMCFRKEQARTFPPPAQNGKGLGALDADACWHVGDLVSGWLGSPVALHHVCCFSLPPVLTILTRA